MLKANEMSPDRPPARVSPGVSGPASRFPCRLHKEMSEAGTLPKCPPHTGRAGLSSLVGFQALRPILAPGADMLLA
jgi:hypothetical protein